MPCSFHFFATPTYKSQTCTLLSINTMNIVPNIFANRRPVLFCFMICAILNMYIVTSRKHSCAESIKEFSMRPSTSDQETLIASIQNSNKLPQRCSWKVSMRDIQEPTQLLLEPLMQHTVESAPGINRSQCNVTVTLRMLRSNDQATAQPTLLPLTPFIIGVTNSDQSLIVDFAAAESKEQAEYCNPMRLLAISTVVKGYCGTHMLSSKSRCYFVSKMRINGADLENTGLQITAFSGMSDMQQLAKDNDRRMQQFPFNRPLKPSSPVRVGVYRCPGSMKAFYLEPRNGTCGIKGFDLREVSAKFKYFPAEPQCASIMRFGVGSDFQLGFSNCRNRMVSLLSFPETPRDRDDPCHGLRAQSICNGAEWHRWLHDSGNTSTYEYTGNRDLSTDASKVGTTFDNTSSRNDIYGRIINAFRTDCANQNSENGCNIAEHLNIYQGDEVYPSIWEKIAHYIPFVGLASLAMKLMWKSWRIYRYK